MQTNFKAGHPPKMKLDKTEKRHLHHSAQLLEHIGKMCGHEDCKLSDECRCTYAAEAIHDLLADQEQEQDDDAPKDEPHDAA